MAPRGDEDQHARQSKLAPETAITAGIVARLSAALLISPALPQAQDLDPIDRDYENLRIGRQAMAAEPP